jgi:hypothetical protein
MWLRALRLPTIAVALSWLLPTWLALVSWGPTRAAIDLADSTGFRGVSLGSVFASLFFAAGLVFRVSRRLRARSRKTRLLAAGESSRRRQEGAEQARLERIRRDYETCDPDERRVLAAVVDIGDIAFNQSQLLRATGGARETWQRLDAALDRLGARGYLQRWSSQSYNEGETIRISEHVFRAISMDPSLVGSASPAKRFA